MGMSVKKSKGKKSDAPVAAKKPEKRAEPQTMVNGKEIRGIVRMAGKDLKGHLKLTRAIQAISGIGQAIGKVLAISAVKELKVAPNTLIGELSEEQIEHLEGIITQPHKYGVLPFMLNRQKSFQDGKAVHLTGTDLQYAVKQDVEHEQDSQTWRGFRHAYGQKVRGQHTRSTGRKGMTVGVMRKSIKGATAPAAGAAPPAAAKAVSKEKK